jgi:chromosomal replication initiation ATPase DnaA
MITAKSPAQIVEEICRHEQMTTCRMQAQVRDARTARVRLRCVRALHAAGVSLTEIGELVGRRHSTVHYLLHGRGDR